MLPSYTLRRLQWYPLICRAEGWKQENALRGHDGKSRCGATVFLHDRPAPGALGVSSWMHWIFTVFTGNMEKSTKKSMLKTAPGVQLPTLKLKAGEGLHFSLGQLLATPGTWFTCYLKFKMQNGNDIHHKSTSIASRRSNGAEPCSNPVWTPWKKRKQSTTTKLEKQMATFVYTTVFAFPVNKIASPSKMATMRSSIDLPCSIAWGEPSDFGMSATSVFSSRFSFWQFDSQNSALKQSKEASGAARMAPERVCASTFWIGRFAEVLQKPLSLNLLNISTLTLPQELVRAVDEIEDMGVPAGLTIVQLSALVPLLCLSG